LNVYRENDEVPLNRKKTVVVTPLSSLCVEEMNCYTLWTEIPVGLSATPSWCALTMVLWFLS